MRRLLLIPGLFVTLVVVGIQGRTQPVTPAEPLRTAGELPADIRHLRLDLTVDLSGKSVTGRATLSLTALRKLGSVTLDAEGFEVKTVELATGQGKLRPAPFSHDKHQLVIDFDPPLGVGDTADVVVGYHVRSPKKGLSFYAPSRSEPDVPLTVWSQGEAIEARHWIPCFDRPNVRQSTELVVTVAEGNEVLSNGKLLGKTRDAAAKTVTFHWRQEEPHPAYLITMVVGPYAVVEDRWRDTPVQYYVPPSRKGDAKRTFGRTPQMIEVFSKKFGVDYPWGKYAQVVAEQFGGGMENTSATTLGDCLLDERAARDEDEDGLIAHELGHQWWGDLVTCRDWAHLWLNEGFASYCESIWAEHRHGADEYSLDVWYKGRAARGAIDRPVVDRRYPNPDSMFDARAYPKGAFILHMLRQRMGDETFFTGLKRYLVDNRLRSVETVDFRRAMERVSGQDLERFFYDWTERPGHPKLDVRTAYDSEAKRVRVTVKQTQPGDPFHFPLTVRVTAAGAKPVTVVEPIDGPTHTIQIPVAGRPLGVEIDPGQGVLAEVVEEKGRDWWVWQLGDGATAAARVTAAVHFGKSKEAVDRETLAAALRREKQEGVAAELMYALAESGGDPSRDALVGELKSPNPKRRRAAATALARFGKDETIAAAVRAVLTAGDPSLGVETAALTVYGKQQASDAVKVLSPWLDKPSNRERLRTTTLAALADTRDPAAVNPLIGWTKQEKSPTCRSAALAALGRLTKEADLPPPEREKAVRALAAVLSDESTRVRRAAVAALGHVGPEAKVVLPRLDEVAAHDPVETVADAARKAAASVRGAPPPLELKQLREELERVRKDQEELRNRLRKYEKGERQGSR